MKIIKSLFTFANIAVFLFSANSEASKTKGFMDLINNEQNPNVQPNLSFVEIPKDEKDDKKKLDATAVEAESNFNPINLFN